MLNKPLERHGEARPGRRVPWAMAGCTALAAGQGFLRGKRIGRWDGARSTVEGLAGEGCEGREGGEEGGSEYNIGQANVTSWKGGRVTKGTCLASIVSSCEDRVKRPSLLGQVTGWTARAARGACGRARWRRREGKEGVVEARERRCWYVPALSALLGRRGTEASRGTRVLCAMG